MSRRKGKMPPFMPAFVHMVESKAWQALSNKSWRAYTLMFIKKKTSDPKEEIVLSYGSIEHIMARNAFARAIEELEDWGFIKRTQHGGLRRRYNKFCQSNEYLKYNNDIHFTAKLELVNAKRKKRNAKKKKDAMYG